MVVAISVGTGLWLQAAAYKAPRGADGKPNLNGIWQAMNTANWDVQGHAAQPGLVVALGAVWLWMEFSSKGILAISNLNTYNFLLIMLGLLLHWRPRRFLAAVAEGVPAVAGILFQFPLYGSIAYMLIQPKGPGGSLAELVAGIFVHVSSQGLLPVTLAIGPLLTTAPLERMSMKLPDDPAKTSPEAVESTPAHD